MQYLQHARVVGAFAVGSEAVNAGWRVVEARVPLGIAQPLALFLMRSDHCTPALTGAVWATRSVIESGVLPKN